MARFDNMETGNGSIQIVRTDGYETHDYLIYHEGLYYYWLESTSTTENIGGYETEEEALEAYGRNDEAVYEIDVDGWWMVKENEGMVNVGNLEL